MVSVSAMVSVMPSVMPVILNLLFGLIRCNLEFFSFLNIEISDPESIMNEHMVLVIDRYNFIKFVAPRFIAYAETGSVADLKNFLVAFVV